MSKYYYNVLLRERKQNAHVYIFQLLDGNSVINVNILIQIYLNNMQNLKKCLRHTQAFVIKPMITKWLIYTIRVKILSTQTREKLLDSSHKTQSRVVIEPAVSRFTQDCYHDTMRPVNHRIIIQKVILNEKNLHFSDSFV